MEHAHELSATFGCDGLPLTSLAGGSWQGHVYPGCLFILWGIWWVYSATITYLAARARWHPFRSRAFYPFPLSRLRLIEPTLKMIFPVLGVSMELYLDHLNDGGFQHPRCPPGTARAGSFDITNMNNWQHAATYPAIFLSGAIDLLSDWDPDILPSGSSHASLAIAFGIMSFLMGTHEKHEAQDKAVHWLLFVAMTIAFLMIVLEMHAPANPLIALGRGAGALLQGAWLVQIGKIEFEDRPQWRVDPRHSSGGHSAGAMMAHVYFVGIALLVVVCIMVFFAGMHVLCQTVLKDALKWLVPLNKRPYDALPRFDSDHDNSKSDRPPVQKFHLTPFQELQGGDFVDGSAHESPRTLKRVMAANAPAPGNSAFALELSTVLQSHKDVDV